MLARHARQRMLVYLDVLPVRLYLCLQKRTRLAMLALKLKNLLSDFDKSKIDNALSAELVAALSRPGITFQEVDQAFDHFADLVRAHRNVGNRDIFMANVPHHLPRKAGGFDADENGVA